MYFSFQLLYWANKLWWWWRHTNYVKNFPFIKLCKGDMNRRPKPAKISLQISRVNVSVGNFVRKIYNPIEEERNRTLMSNTHRRRRLDETVELRRVGGVGFCSYRPYECSYKIWIEVGLLTSRDSRKSRQKMVKNTADFCENRKNHGKNTAKTRH